MDSARSAVLAAISAQLELATFIWPEDAEVRVRIGLHTAEPHLAEDGYVGVGVHRAARICDAAHGGQILLSNATGGIIEDAELPGAKLIDLGEHRLKGLPHKQRLLQLQVPGLPSQFAPPRTPEADTQVPGVATFLISDLVGWRHLIDELGDDEASASLIADYQAAATNVVETNNGIVLERGGDYVLAVFTAASDALRAAGAHREAVRDFAWPGERDPAIAIAVHSGRWSGDPRRPAASTALSRLVRITRAAEPGQVLVSQATAALLEGEPGVPTLRSLGDREIPDFEEPVRVYELP